MCPAAEGRKLFGFPLDWPESKFLAGKEAAGLEQIEASSIFFHVSRAAAQARCQARRQARRQARS